ncbi:MAG: hypothetical protein J6Y19_01410, partial [Kiritimatiellae bacterium]|nr:hypothetical protein [Kiritimatiellia bacterium]
IGGKTDCGMMSEKEELSFGEMETLRSERGGEAVSEGEKSFGDRDTLRDGEGWGILEEWGGKRWKPGEEILGRYIVERELGQGGWGWCTSAWTRWGEFRWR